MSGVPVTPIPVVDCKENPIDVCTSSAGPAVLARSLGAVGVSASGTTGVLGQSLTADGSGVMGENRVGPGTSTGNGVTGVCDQANGSGVWGNNTGGGYGIAGNSDAAGGIGVYGRGGKLAGRFEGHVEATGSFKCGNPNVTNPTAGTLYVEVDVVLQNQDCAEDFEVSLAEEIDPGTVVVIDSEGALKRSNRPYDKRVAGVVSGAGERKPGIILGRQNGEHRRMPVALVGRVYCKVDARHAAIEVGDLLTTASTPGHAMKAEDRNHAFGAVIGKALRGLETGQGLIPILVALQ